MANTVKIQLDDPTLPAILDAVNKIRTAVDTVKGLPLEHRAPLFAHLKDTLKAAADAAAAEAAAGQP